MKFFVFGLVSLSLASIFVACSTPTSIKKDSRAPASIREVASYIDKKILDPLQSIKHKGPNHTQKFDTNSDGKSDIVQIFKNYKLVIEKKDRNFDGVFDYTKTCKDNICKIKADDDHNGSHERFISNESLAKSKVKQTYKNSKTKTSYSLTLYGSNLRGNSEGKFVECTNCGNKNYDMPKERLCEFNPITFEVTGDDCGPRWESVTLPGHKDTYFNIFKDIKDGPQLFIAESCDDKGYSTYRLAEESHKALSTLVSCFDNKIKTAKDPRVAQGARDHLAKVEAVLLNRDNPLKLQCHGWKEEGKYTKFSRTRTTDDPDYQNAIVLYAESRNLDENDYSHEYTETFIHELMHSLDPDYSHGIGSEFYHSCVFSCLDDMRVKYFKGDKDSMVKSCYSEHELKENGSLSLDPEPYSHIYHSLEILKYERSGSTFVPLILNQLARDYGNKPNKLSDLQTNLSAKIEKRLIDAFIFQARAEVSGPLTNFEIEDFNKVISEQKGKPFDPSKIKSDGALLSTLKLLYSNTIITNDIYSRIFDEV